jgi:hypothetical protein
MEFFEKPQVTEQWPTSLQRRRYECSPTWSAAKRNGTWGVAAQTNEAWEARGTSRWKMRFCRLFHRLLSCRFIVFDRSVVISVLADNYHPKAVSFTLNVMANDNNCMSKLVEDFARSECIETRI